MNPHKHGWTQGPWGVHPHRAFVVPADHVTRPIGGSDDPAFDLATYAQEICAMHWPDQHRLEQEVKANARLVAASPELYEALEAADEALAQFTAFEDDARYIMGNTNFAIVQERRKQIRAALSKAKAPAEGEMG